MKHPLIFSFLAVLLLSFTMSAGNVYICVSKTASKYHYNRNCRGLQKCTHKIEAVSKEAAVKRGYSLCGYED